MSKKAHHQGQRTPGRRSKTAPPPTWQDVLTAYKRLPEVDRMRFDHALLFEEPESWCFRMFTHTTHHHLAERRRLEDLLSRTRRKPDAEFKKGPNETWDDVAKRLGLDSGEAARRRASRANARANKQKGTPIVTVTQH